MAPDSSAMAELIGEIHWLSAELKKRTALRSEQERVFVASKGLLETIAEQGPRTVPAIAEARNTSRQNIQVIANRLAELGCIEFVPNPHHKKSDLVRMTPSGTALLKSSNRQESTVLNGISHQLKPEQIHTAIEALLELRGALTTEKESRRPAATVNHSSETSRDVVIESKGALQKAEASRPALQEPEFDEDDSLPVNLL